MYEKCVKELCKKDTLLPLHKCLGNREGPVHLVKRLLCQTSACEGSAKHYYILDIDGVMTPHTFLLLLWCRAHTVFVINQEDLLSASEGKRNSSSLVWMGESFQRGFVKWSWQTEVKYFLLLRLV